MNQENLTAFYSLFSQYRFHVPDYQRGYSWEEAQWTALIDDLSTLTDHNDHFTGLLVLHESKDPDLRIKCKGVIKDVYDVVDGQQRLTTIVILLGELHRAMKAEDDEDLQEIADDIVPHYLYAAGPGSMLVPHLVLDRLNHNFFTGRILGIGPADMLGAEIQSHRNLLGAQAYFRDYLNRKSGALGKDYPDWLAGLYEKIANQMKVMVYKLKSEADAGVVFESMNNRGKKPNQLDLVKNYLLFLASKLGAEMNRELTGRINEAWEVIFKQLTAAGRPEDEETLLQMHWLAAYDHDLRHWNSAGENKSNLVKRRFSLLDYLDRYDELFQDLQQYVASLRNAAVAFADLSMPEDRSELSVPMFAREAALRKEVSRLACTTLSRVSLGTGLSWYSRTASTVRTASYTSIWPASPGFSLPARSFNNVSHRNGTCLHEPAGEQQAYSAASVLLLPTPSNAKRRRAGGVNTGLDRGRQPLSLFG